MDTDEINPINSLIKKIISICKELYARQSYCAFWGIVLAINTVIGFILNHFDHRTLRGIGVWHKPIKFSISGSMLLLFNAWYTGLLPEEVRRSILNKIVNWFTVTVGGIEYYYICYQGSIAEPSHYNKSDPLHEFFFTLMFYGIIIFTSSQLVLAWQITRHHKVRPLPTYVLSAVVGLCFSFFLSFITGLFLGNRQPPSGIDFLFAGWHFTGLDYRPAHFLGVHAQLFIPLFGFYLQKYLKDWSKFILILVSLLYLFAWFYLIRVGMQTFYLVS